ncbi:hypothetical protein ROHU_035502 [Labeo rohita]|uniref:Uncharacterized protein n=1 Tax=Labeo rohita TaxID=84645 RepID=A0A498LF70_LABRO|nr:hypothetical protein ROHU_035502 [Labeo rohita]
MSQIPLDWGCKLDAAYQALYQCDSESDQEDKTFPRALDLSIHLHKPIKARNSFTKLDFYRQKFYTGQLLRIYLALSFITLTSSVFSDLLIVNFSSKLSKRALMKEIVHILAHLRGSMWEVSLEAQKTADLGLSAIPAVNVCACVCVCA